MREKTPLGGQRGNADKGTVMREKTPMGLSISRAQAMSFHRASVYETYTIMIEVNGATDDCQHRQKGGMRGEMPTVVGTTGHWPESAKGTRVRPHVVRRG